MNGEPLYEDTPSAESAWDALAMLVAPDVRSVAAVDLPAGRRERWRRRLPNARFSTIAFNGRAALPNAAFAADDAPYDLALLADALGRLYDPWDFLVQLHARLAPHGRVAAFVPNVRNIILLHHLAEGDFSYPAGAIEQDHLRLFTRSSAIAMFEETGYRVERLTFVRDPRCAGMGLPAIGTCNVETDKLVVRDTSPQNRSELTAAGFVLLARPTRPAASGPSPGDGEEREHAR